MLSPEEVEEEPFVVPQEEEEEEEEEDMDWRLLQFKALYETTQASLEEAQDKNTRLLEEMNLVKGNCISVLRDVDLTKKRYELENSALRDELKELRIREGARNTNMERLQNEIRRLQFNSELNGQVPTGDTATINDLRFQLSSSQAKADFLQQEVDSLAKENSALLTDVVVIQDESHTLVQKLKGEAMGLEEMLVNERAMSQQQINHMRDVMIAQHERIKQLEISLKNKEEERNAVVSTATATGHIKYFVSDSLQSLRKFGEASKSVLDHCDKLEQELLDLKQRHAFLLSRIAQHREFISKVCKDEILRLLSAQGSSLDGSPEPNTISSSLFYEEAHQRIDLAEGEDFAPLEVNNPETQRDNNNNDNPTVMSDHNEIVCGKEDKSSSTSTAVTNEGASTSKMTTANSKKNEQRVQEELTHDEQTILKLIKTMRRAQKQWTGQVERSKSRIQELENRVYSTQLTHFTEMDSLSQKLRYEQKRVKELYNKLTVLNVSIEGRSNKDIT